MVAQNMKRIMKEKGITNAAMLEENLGTKLFFTDPYAFWQRGLNENTSGLLRQYFPQKYDFLRVTPE